VTNIPPLLRSLIAAPLLDLGEAREEFRDIYAPADAEPGAGVTDAFLGGADTHHQKYFDVAYVDYMLGVALDSIAPVAPPGLILDVGSGSGPSVIALLERFPAAHVVATDTSPQLLAILRRELIRRSLIDRCVTICIDLNAARFTGAPIDLIVGSAILHHLFEPDRLLEHLFPAVRGAMIFFEPFEPGHAMLGLVYRLLLARCMSADPPLPAPIAALLPVKISQFAQTTCTQKDPVRYADIDDKWAFTVSWFEDVGRRIGASRVLFGALNHTGHPFADYLRTDLRIALGVDAATLPPWVHALIAEIEAGMSEACKRDFALARTVAFVR
jgi:SAM-dependent methyltransferase